jgi:hypothetical protein
MDIQSKVAKTSWLKEMKERKSKNKELRKGGNKKSA